MPNRDRYKRTRGIVPAGVFVACALGAGLGAPACSSEDSQQGGSGESNACLTTRAFYAKKVSPQVVQKVCEACHAPGGDAYTEAADLVVLPSSYPGFIDKNLASFKSLATVQQDGKSVVLLKPTGELNHGGGQRIAPDSDEYKLLAELIERLQQGDPCAGEEVPANFDQIEVLGELATFRKASLELVGRLPTPEEIESLREGGLAALPAAIDGLMTEPAFLARIKELFNDIYLTDRYLRYNGFALQILSSEQFPATDYEANPLDDDTRWQATLAVSREPLELIAHIVENNLPFSEVLTADYTMVNPYSAPMLNAQVSFDDPSNPDEFKPAKIRSRQEDGSFVEYPHAGILTSPMWLNRFPSSQTNRNRHRARMVYKFFLATDVLRVAERPIDPAETAKYQNPTRDDPTCTSCHRQIDPVAGAFQKFHPDDPEEFDPERDWYPEMFPPGFAGEDMEVSDFGSAPQWLAQRIVNDERFVLASVYTVFTALMGREPIGYPQDPDDPEFETQLRGWERQDQLFRQIGEKFVADNYNLKTVFREVILSPYYRAANTKAELDAAAALEFSHVGTGALLTPEKLARKLEAAVGFPWARSWDRSSWLETDYEILYGGIDSDTITARLTTPNGVMANVAWRMGNEVACDATAWDFTREPNQRSLFPYVTAEHRPLSDTGNENSGDIEDIKRNIQYLHAHLLGEELELDSPEIERTYQLFLETYKEGAAGLEDGSIENGMVWQCRGRTDRLTGEELPENQRIDDDPNFVIRSWMAVVTYLLTDYKFLHD